MLKRLIPLSAAGMLLLLAAPARALVLPAEPPQARAERLFERCDRNHDGVIDQQEFAQGMRQLATQGPRANRQGPGARGPRGPEGRRGRGPETPRGPETSWGPETAPPPMQVMPPEPPLPPGPEGIRGDPDGRIQGIVQETLKRVLPRAMKRMAEGMMKEGGPRLREAVRREVNQIIDERGRELRGAIHSEFERMVREREGRLRGDLERMIDEALSRNMNDRPGPPREGPPQFERREGPPREGPPPMRRRGPAPPRGFGEERPPRPGFDRGMNDGPGPEPGWEREQDPRQEEEGWEEPGRPGPDGPPPPPQAGFQKSRRAAGAHRAQAVRPWGGYWRPQMSRQGPPGMGRQGRMANRAVPGLFKNLSKSRGFLKRLDRNHDGAITAREFATAMKKLFDRLDRNDDGRIKRGEFAKDKQRLRDDHRMKQKDQRPRRARGNRPFARAE